MQAKVAIMMPRMSRYGGAEGFGLRLAETLAAEGHGVDFVCARQEVEAPAGVRPVAVGRLGLGRALKSLWFAYAAERVRQKNAYDVSVSLGKTLNQDILRVGGAPLLAFWRRSIGAWPAGPVRWFKMLRRRLSPANWVGLALERAQFGGTGAIVAVSHLARECILEAHPEVDPRRIRVVYNRPDPARFAPPDADLRVGLRAASGVGEGDVLLLFAGTNFALKGLAPLVRALARLPANFRLHVAGGRNTGRYERLASRLGLAGRVRFLGRVTDMASFYAAGDVFALPTFFDACSNAVLEALACGLRVVSSRANGSSYFLPERFVVADPGDVAALAEALRAAAAEPWPGPFVWPGDVETGLDPYLALVREALEKKRKAE